MLDKYGKNTGRMQTKCWTNAGQLLQTFMKQVGVGGVSKISSNFDVRGVDDRVAPSRQTAKYPNLHSRLNFIVVEYRRDCRKEYFQAFVSFGVTLTQITTVN